MVTDGLVVLYFNGNRCKYATWYIEFNAERYTQEAFFER